MRLAAVAAALLLVLAGCGGALGPRITATPDDGTERPTQTPSADVMVIGGDLPVDANLVFQRVLNLTGERVPGPVVYVENRSTEANELVAADRSQFRTALGVAPPNRSARLHPIAYTPTEGNSVELYDRAFGSERGLESTLAHEFTHVVQFQTEWDHSVWTVDPAVGKGAISNDRELTYRLVLEGAAEYVQYHYERQFLPELPNGLEQRSAAYANASAHERLLLAPYALGGQYVAERADSPRDLERVHRHPPESTEQVLHNSTDPVEDLTVTTETGNWRVETRDRQGELFLRIALRTELNRSTAVDAAAGWGEDRRLTFVRGNATATAWVLRWDDADNATEFERAFERYLDAKATERDGVWYQNDGNATYRLTQPSNETTAVLLGDEAFVRAATVDSTREEAVEVRIAE